MFQNLFLFDSEPSLPRPGRCWGSECDPNVKCRPFITHNVDAALLLHVKLILSASRSSPRQVVPIYVMRLHQISRENILIALGALALTLVLLLPQRAATCPKGRTYEEAIPGGGCPLFVDENQDGICDLVQGVPFQSNTTSTRSGGNFSFSFAPEFFGIARRKHISMQAGLGIQYAFPMQEKNVTLDLSSNVLPYFNLSVGYGF